MILKNIKSNLSLNLSIAVGIASYEFFKNLHRHSAKA